MLCLDKITIGSYVDRNETVWYILFFIRSNVELYFTDEFCITLDECSNIKNIDSEDLNMHDYSISVDGDTWLGDVSEHELPSYPDGYSSQITTYDDPGSDNTREHVYIFKISTVDPSNFLQYLDDNIKYIRILKGVLTYNPITTESNDDDKPKYNYTKVEGIMYDPNALYHAEIRMLNTFCDTCLDDKQMQLIMLLTFKRQLLEQSIQCMHYKDTLQYYLDLCRILNIYVAKKDYGTSSKGCNSCLKYWNDTCAKYEDSSCIKLQRPICNGPYCSLC